MTGFSRNTIACALASACLIGTGARADIVSANAQTDFLNMSTQLIGALGSPTGRRASGAASLGAGPTTFDARYAWGLSADPTSNGGTNDTTVSGDSRWSMTFDVTDAGPWALVVQHRRVGALTTDPASSFDENSATMAPIVGSATGASLLSGSLGLPSFVFAPSDATVNQSINQTGSAVLTGSGPTSVTLSFVWSNIVRAESSFIAAPGAIALRMGEDSSFTNSTIGAYPGVGSRPIAQDGHFVSVTLVPAPGAGMVLMAGGVLSLRRRRRIG